jgi:hypothetical protein
MSKPFDHLAFVRSLREDIASGPEALANELRNFGFDVGKPKKSAVPFSITLGAPDSGERDDMRRPGTYAGNAAQVRLSGIGTSVQGAWKLQHLELSAWKQREWIAGNPRPANSVDLEAKLADVMGTNYGSIMSQLQTALSRASKAEDIPEPYVNRMSLWLSQSKRGEKLQGSHPVTTDDASAAARKGSLTLGKSLGTRRIGESRKRGVVLEPGDQIEWSALGRVVAHLTVYDTDHASTVSAVSRHVEGTKEPGPYFFELPRYLTVDNLKLEDGEVENKGDPYYEDGWAVDEDIDGVYITAPSKREIWSFKVVMPEDKRSKVGDLLDDQDHI